MKRVQQGSAEGRWSAWLGMVTLVGMVAAPIPARSAQVDYIHLALEEPLNGAIASGISNLRGWAVGKFGIERVEFQLDDQEIGRDIPYGGKRSDVGGSFNYPNDDYSGFSMALNYGLLDEGPHTITVRAWDMAQDHNEITHSFEVLRIGDLVYVDQDDAVDLSEASGIVSGNEVLIYNAGIQGNHYNFTLAWNPQSQRPDLLAVTAFDLTQMLDASGLWDLTSTTDASECGATSTTQADATLQLTVQEDRLDLNGLELFFDGINANTLGTKFTGLQATEQGDIEWSMEIGGNGLTGSGVQQLDDCTLTYELVGTKQAVATQ